MGTRICICILNFNNAPKTIECLKSIFVQSFTDYQVILIDNKSSDNSVEVISDFLTENNLSFSICIQNETENHDWDHSEKAVILKANENGGYSSGNNLGIRYAQKTGNFTHILIINNDILLPENFLKSMLHSYNLEKTKWNSRNIAMGAKEADIHGKIISKGFYYLIIPLGLVSAFPWVPFFRYITGSCIFLPINTPMMDERYFLYYDDVEFSKTLKNNKFVLSACNNTVYYHEEGGSTKSDPLRHRIIFKSMKRFYLQNYPYFFPLVVILRSLINIILGRFRLTVDLIRIAIKNQ